MYRCHNQNCLLVFLLVVGLKGLVILVVIAGCERLKMKKLTAVGVLMLLLAYHVLFLNKLLNQGGFSSQVVYYMLGNILRRLREYFLSDQL